MKKQEIMGCNVGLRKMGVLLAVLNMCWGVGGVDGLGGSNSFFQPTFDSVILSYCIGMLLEYRSCIMKISVAD
jgi:hypothetical protein